VSVRKGPEVYIRKYGGNDSLSWAVFARGNPTPIVTGLSRREAQYEKTKVKLMLAERANRDRNTF
jgi:hypothetical protein